MNEITAKLLRACESAAVLYDHLALGPLGMAAKYGPDAPLFDEDAEILSVRRQLQEAINAAKMVTT